MGKNTRPSDTLTPMSVDAHGVVIRGGVAFIVQESGRTAVLNSAEGRRVAKLRGLSAEVVAAALRSAAEQLD